MSAVELKEIATARVHNLPYQAELLSNNSTQPMTLAKDLQLLKNSLKPARSIYMENTAMNTIESSLLLLLNQEGFISTEANGEKFYPLFQMAQTEGQQAIVLIVLRATAASSLPFRSNFVSKFEQFGGLKIVKTWLNRAIEYHYTDLLLLLLQVLKVLPLQLSSITEARINEPIVKLKKTSQDDKIKRAAQELLKVWRTRFTEKEKTTKTANSSKSSSSSNNSNVVSASTSSTSTLVSSTPSFNAPSNITPKLKDPKKLNGANKSSSNGSSTTDVLGSLLRKNTKDVKNTKLKDNSSIIKQVKGSKVKMLDSTAIKSSPPLQTANVSTNNTLKSNESKTSSTKPKEPFVDEVALPTIQSFGERVEEATAQSSTRKIKWADETGQDLVKIKLIESWRDFVSTANSHDHDSFRDAKLREQANERSALQNKLSERLAQIKPTIEWKTPPLIQFPVSEENKLQLMELSTEEVKLQTNRTRKEMEYLVLSGEVPPISPKEWTRSGSDILLGPPTRIPLTDGSELVPQEMQMNSIENGQNGQNGQNGHQDMLHTLRNVLDNTTYHLLYEEKQLVPVVYEEFHRNGNQISNARVMEILQRQQYHHYHAAPHTSHPSSSTYPPPHTQPLAYSNSDYPGHQNNSSTRPLSPNGSIKRKATVLLSSLGNSAAKRHALDPSYGNASHGNGAGNVALLPPPNSSPPSGVNPPQAMRSTSNPQQPCLFFNSPAGCKGGDNCPYSHDIKSNNGPNISLLGQPSGGANLGAPAAPSIIPQRRSLANSHPPTNGPGPNNNFGNYRPRPMNNGFLPNPRRGGPPPRGGHGHRGGGGRNTSSGRGGQN